MPTVGLRCREAKEMPQKVKCTSIHKHGIPHARSFFGAIGSRIAAT